MKHSYDRWPDNMTRKPLINYNTSPTRKSSIDWISVGCLLGGIILFTVAEYISK